MHVLGGAVLVRLQDVRVVGVLFDNVDDAAAVLAIGTLCHALGRPDAINACIRITCTTRRLVAAQNEVARLGVRAELRGVM